MQKLGVIGFPMDLGGNRRGVDMGPSALRLTGIIEQLKQLGHDVKDYGDVFVRARGELDRGTGDAHYLPEILRACDSAAELTAEAANAGRTPLLLGGDHSVTIGTLRGMASLHGKGGVVWIDAHADFNTPKSSPSGNVHGMPLATALGLCSDDERFSSGKWPAQTLDPKHSVIVAVRDIDPHERELLLNHPNAPHVITMQEIDREGIVAVAKRIKDIVSGAAFTHISLDLDSLDPVEAPGVGTPVRGGLTYREAHTLLELLREGEISSMDVVEVNPILDSKNQTAETATALVRTMFGANIL